MVLERRQAKKEWGVERSKLQKYTERSREGQCLV
jgi:hypothetical protein